MKREITNAVYTCLILVFYIGLFLPRSYATSYFSYQSGNWNGTNIWTTDSTGTTLVNSATPANNDKVYVLTGRTITASANITTTGHTVTINIGAVLNLGTYTLTAITLNGTGLLRINRTTLPVINGGTFLSAGGGTVEYYTSSGSFDIDPSRPTYNNLKINLGATSQVITVAQNLTMYGSLTITRGTFQINNTSTTKRTIIVSNDLVVASTGKITTGTGNTNTVPYSIASNNLPPSGQFHTIFHELTIGGDFTNNGVVRFTNLTAPNYGEFASTGAVTVRFTGESNNAISLNGVTDFYNLIIDKGSDQTYTLEIISAAYADFALYGPNSVGRNEASPFTADNPEVRKALWIKNGTLKLSGTMLIPSLTEGYISGADGNGDYAIGSNGQLWVAGANVSVYSTATNASGFPEAPAGSLGVKAPGTVHQALSIYGKFRISAGFLGTRHSAGIIFWNTSNSNSAVIVEGGTVNVSVMRTTYTSSGKTSYLQTGGTVIVRGDETEAGELNSYPVFAIPDPNSSFIMSGGDIIIRDRNNGNTTEGNGIFLNCDPGNFSVTGGNITIETNATNTPSFDVQSRVSLWNLIIKRLGTSGNPVVNLMYNLTVSNNLTINANSTLYSGTSYYTVSVAGDFKINSGGTYTPGNNLTLFNGSGNYFLWNEGTITGGLYNLQVNKELGSLILVSPSGAFTVRNDLIISDGLLADGGNFVYVQGNVTNNGTHAGAGKISLNKSGGTQTISGNGSGIFQNLELNNTTGSAGSVQVSLSADITVTGNLILANDRLFNIGNYQLTLAELATVSGTLGNSRFILTSGAPSDGGLRRIYTDTLAFTYPVGTGTNYTPVSIHIRKIPISYGSIAVKPVSSRHPFTTSTNAMNYYWKVEDDDFEGVKPGSVRLNFNYGTLADNTAYVPGKYVPASWTFINDVTLVNETLNLINFLTENTIAGDYTAGYPDAFGQVAVFYSRVNGPWSSPTTWSNVGFGGVAASTIPGAANPVFIGNGSTYNHTVTVTTGNAVSGSLSLQSGSVLNLGTTSGNNFGFVLPGSNGTLRISSSGATALFPAGDFGYFLGAEGGTVEYYSGSLAFTLPVTSSAPTSRSVKNYFNLILSPNASASITLPNLSLLVFGNLSVTGATAASLARLNAVGTQTLTIKNDLLVVSGTLTYQNTIAQAISVENNITVSSGAIFNVSATGTGVANSLKISGSLTNDGTFDMSVSSTIKCDVTFTGNTYATVSGRGATTDFYSLTLNKGTSQVPVLDVVSDAFTFTNNTAPLTLVNGTFRLNNTALSVNIASMGLSIPATTCLSAYGGTLQVATSASDDADVELIGLLEVRGGTINVGTSSNNYNNDIEYAGAGTPTIQISAGTLFVNGQIRRSLINGLGSLSFDQSGSASVVIVNGHNAQSVRAKFEILNTGSVFNMSGGTLTIVRGGSLVFNDLVLRPESSSVTGGTIVFGNTSTETTNNVNSYIMDTSIPLYNLTVDGTTNPKTVTLYVHGLTLKNNLTINATSVFKADSLDVKIAGNFTNLNTNSGTGVSTGGFQPGSVNQVTTFNGSATNQTITGAAGNITNFANLIIYNTKTSGTVTLQSNTALRVNNDLTLSRGTLADGGNVITVIGNIINSAVHSGTGRIVLAGTTVQNITGNGNGKFGNLFLNASKDVKMSSYIEITGVLTFQTKMLDIGNNFLKLSNTGAAISGSTSTSYIRTDGLISDAGIQKAYPATAYTFTFPVGVIGKYTPAVLNVTTNNVAGTITMTPVNRAHPCRSGSGTTTIVSYYWHTTSTGLTGSTVTHVYTYVQGDAGNENSYVGDRYYSGLWDSPAGGTVNVSSNEITFSGKTYIDGDYTAGRSTEFQSVLTYYSRNATCTSPTVGNWTTNATWSTDPVLKHAGAAATTYPTGEPVVIATNHIVSTDVNSCQSSNVALNGTGILTLGTTVGHFLGIMTGTGTIKLTASAANYFVFPSGNFTSFTSGSGGTVELNSTSGTSVFPYLTTYNNLVLIGAGIKQMIDADIILNGTLTNSSSSGFTASAVGNLILTSNWVNDGTFSHNGGTTIFDGNTTISGANPPVMNNVIINSGKSLTPPPSSTIGIAGDWVNNGSFNHNNGTVSFSGNTTISGSAALKLNNVQIASGGILTGKASDDIIVIGNWVNNGSFINNKGRIVFDGNSLVSGNSSTMFGYIQINSSRSVTGPPSGTMYVAYDFFNNGTFNNNGGTLYFNGKIQTLGGTSSTLFENLTVGSESTTTITASDQQLRGILRSDGILNVDYNLTLLSSATQTALIDGAGEGQIKGSLRLQRYFPSRFGYKYLGSPFKELYVGQYGAYMDLYASFPTFYRYDENRNFTGWITYTGESELLVPMHAYAVNFGPDTGELILELDGEVNNNTQIPYTMFNSNRTFTLGFNLISNPYPSPIDWNTSGGWIRSNIDNALYYFNAGGADQYTGVYSTYIDGISSDGIANNIIPAMQGFFIHVTDGSYPVAATLIFTNNVRVNNLNPHFHKSAYSDTRPMLRISARIAEEGKSADPAVIYFDPDATMNFDKEKDALKLMNTDVTVPSFYSISPDERDLSIFGMPYPFDSVTVIPMGIRLKTGGDVLFSLQDMEQMPMNLFIYFCDSKTGTYQNLNLHPEYKVFLASGDYENRFSVIFSRYDLRHLPGADEKFHVYSSRNRLFVYISQEPGHMTDLVIHNIMGQQILRKQMTGNGYEEIDLDVNTGIYVVSLLSDQGVYSKKVFINNQW
jgi:fibronectin-binding autotransporter adhesin